MRLPVLWLAFPLSALVAGCGGGHDATEKQLAELRAEIVKLRASQGALAERIDNVELGRATLNKQAAPPPAPSADADRPDLNVVRLSPSDGDGDADSDAPRPLIRSVGSGVITKDKAGPPGKKPDKAGAPAKKGPTIKP